MKNTTQKLVLQILEQDETVTDAEYKAVKIAMAVPGKYVRENTLTLNEAAVALNCTVRTIQNYITAGKLTFTRDARGHRRIPRHEVVNLV